MTRQHSGLHGDPAASPAHPEASNISVTTTVTPTCTGRPSLDAKPTHGLAHPAPARTASASRGIDSRALFGEARTLVIHHAGMAYLLRITQQNKLILTK